MIDPLDWEEVALAQESDGSYIWIPALDNPVLVKSMITPCACGWQEPYGFVPEADCPEHDNAEFVERMNTMFGAASASATAVIAQEDE